MTGSWLLAPLLCLVASLPAQASGQLIRNRLPVLDYPEDPVADRFAPFRDAQGQPRRAPALAGGFADVDRDGNLDLWLLEGGAGATRELSLLRARTWSLGRFQPWPWTTAQSDSTAVGWRDATRWDAAPYRGRIVGVDPGQSELQWAWNDFTPPLQSHPREGNFWVRPMGATWDVGFGGYELDARDDAQDGCPDFGVLLQLGGQTVLKKLVVAPVAGMPQPVGPPLAFALPAPAERLTLLDADGDRVTDAAVWLPGLGIVLLRDDGAGSLVPAGWFATGALQVQDLRAGDWDRDGRDDLLVTFDLGVVVLRAQGAGLQAQVLLPPAQVGALASAVFADGTSDGDRDVVAFARDGLAFVIFPGLPQGGTFGDPIRREPSATTRQHWTGPGMLGLPVIVGDGDDDGDDDVILQLPSGSEWVTLRAHERSSFALFAALTHDGAWGLPPFVRERFTIQMPESLLNAGVSTVEVVVFRKPPVPGPLVLQGARSYAIDPVRKTVDVPIYMLSNRNEYQNWFGPLPPPNPYPDGLHTGGETLLSFHAKNGSQRWQSTLIHHDPGGDGNKSGLGVKWELRAAPPGPDADDSALPWN